MPTLGLMEAHMPENPTYEDLYSYYGALFTAAHELAGHGTDITDEPTLLIPVGPPDLRHYRTTNPWADAAQELYDLLERSDAPGDRRLSATWQSVATPSGDIVTSTDDIVTATGSNPLLEVSQHAVLHGRRPDAYSDDSPGELYGQVAGQVVSGAPIPFDNAGITVRPRHPEQGRGYAVDPELQRMFEERTGWSRDTARQVNDDEFSLLLATDDPMLRAFIDEARRTPMPNNRITILARVAGLERPQEISSASA
jgi:hypothetical protein